MAFPKGGLWECLIKKTSNNMNKSVLVKLIAMSFLSICLGVLIYFDELRKGALGKEEFLKLESLRYDQHLLHPHILIIIASLFLGLILFGLYELLCFLIFRMIGKSENKGDGQ